MPLSLVIRLFSRAQSGHKAIKSKSGLRPLLSFALGIVCNLPLFRSLLARKAVSEPAFDLNLPFFPQPFQLSFAITARFGSLTKTAISSWPTPACASESAIGMKKTSQLSAVLLGAAIACWPFFGMAQTSTQPGGSNPGQTNPGQTGNPGQSQPGGGGGYGAPGGGAGSTGNGGYGNATENGQTDSGQTDNGQTGNGQTGKHHKKSKKKSKKNKNGDNGSNGTTGGDTTTQPQ